MHLTMLVVEVIILLTHVALCARSRERCRRCAGRGEGWK